MRKAILLVLSLVACGGAAATEKPPVTEPGAKPASTASPPPASSALATKPSVPPTMPKMHATAMEADLKEIGLDPAALPPIAKLPPNQLRKVMKTFTKALGVPCAGCHDTNDFRAATPQKKIATHMWNDFTRGLALEGGGAIYCDSCHEGHKDVLDRRDLKALGERMEQTYVKPLKRTDGRDHTCETCHGDPFEGKIFTKLWK
jgi:hypothetical protein